MNEMLNGELGGASNLNIPAWGDAAVGPAIEPTPLSAPLTLRSQMPCPLGVIGQGLSQAISPGPGNRRYRRRLFSRLYLISANNGRWLAPSP
jgi:hypothetical protein